MAANTMYGDVESVHPSWCWLMQDASSTGAGAGGNGASTSGSGGVTDAEDSPQLQMMEKMMRVRLPACGSMLLQNSPACHPTRLTASWGP